MSYRDFTPNPNFSEQLNQLMMVFIDRLDMSSRDRELLEDLAMFAYQEGTIAGKEQLLNDFKTIKPDAEKPNE